jgi:hypothetical protein
MSEHINRAKYILGRSNLLDLIKRSFTYFILDRGTYNVYRHRVADVDLSLYNPVLPGFKVKIASSNRDADEFSKDYMDPRKVIFKSRLMLDSGAVAFCIYSGNELAHITWLGLNEKAQRAIDTMPYKIDFEHGEACVGGTYTDPRFRGKGLMVYGNYLKFKYLKSTGVAFLKHAIKEDNAASINGYAKFSPSVVARGRYFKFFGYERWKEIPVKD